MIILTIFMLIVFDADAHPYDDDDYGSDGDDDDDDDLPGSWLC